MGRIMVAALTAVLVLTAAGLAAGGWYYTDELLPAPQPADPDPDTEVLATDPDRGTVTLAATEGDLVELARVGFWTETSTLDLGAVLDQDPRSVTRTATALGDGVWPEPGELGGATPVVWRGDPKEALGLPFEEVVVDGPIGPLPAWRVPVDVPAADHDTWAVLVHGRGASREEMHRTLRTVHEVGLPAFVVSVRNDPEAAQDPDGWGRYGDTEWEDLQAAVDHLIAEEGAQALVAVGSSQGGSLVLSWLRRGQQVERAAAAVLISPLVSMRGTLALQARGRDIPEPIIGPLLWSTRLLADARAGLDFGELEHAERADAYDVPMLLTHGTADSTVPFSDSAALARARPDLVTFARYDGVEHVREWNADPERFDAELSAFLDQQVDALQ